jgi:hypothetical protein
VKRFAIVPFARTMPFLSQIRSSTRRCARAAGETGRRVVFLQQILRLHPNFRDF